MVHDFYYPFVGLENHSSGETPRHRVGVYCDGNISWLDDPNGDWSFKFKYPYDALVGSTTAINKKLGILLEFEDFVDSYVSAFIRNIHVVNLRPENREIKLFMHQAFVISDSRSNTDTAQYLPDNNAILHYRGRRAFVISGKYDNEYFDQHSVGLFGIEGKEGTFRDADDGELVCNSVEHGRVDSTIRFSVKLAAHSSERVHYWIACGTSIREALHINKQITNDTELHNLHRTVDWWREWLQPVYRIMPKIHPEHRHSFLQSVMIIKSQIDKRGAIIASTDTSMLNYSRDAYAYCWPRDGAFALWPLIRMGYKDEAYRFFEFMKKGMHSGGYLFHKYRADGALGSSWHSYIHDGVVAPPIQEDETALTLFMFVQYYNANPDIKLLKDFYHDMVIPMADFMTEYIDHTTGLPKASYDPWEEVFMTGTYTVSTVFAALVAASDLATAAGDNDNSIKWRSAANDIKSAAHKYLYNSSRKVFYKGLNVKNGKIVYNETVDNACVFGPYIFGLFDAQSEEVVSSIKTVEQIFNITDDKIGLPRYENDYYRRTDPKIAGNYWFVTTLWHAQYHIENGNIEKAEKILEWTRNHATSTGVMSEQLDPTNDQTISPGPLTWSHAEYLSTLLDLAAKQKSS